MIDHSQLANAELAIMELLWNENEGLTARMIQEQLYPSATKSHHGTVQRLLTRLEEKGFVKRSRPMGVNLFSSVFSLEFYAARQLESLAKKLTGGSLAPMITCLLEEEKLSSSEINRLKLILDQENVGGEK